LKEIMAYPAAVHQIIHRLAWGDATSNHARLLRGLLRGWGIHSEIYVLSCETSLSGECRPLGAFQPGPRAWLIYQYSLDSPLTEFALAHADRAWLSYHNVTPAHFFAPFDPSFAGRVARARRNLEGLAGLAGALSVSHYNCQELSELGFSRVCYLPLLFSLEGLRASAESPAGRRLRARLEDGGPTILFVGRVSPNKRFEDLIRAFYYYHTLVEPGARLLLVGASPHGAYQAYLDMLVESLGLAESVVFAGRVAEADGFGAYYRAADVFLCLSEHEGFGVPLVESMQFDVPVVAYKAGAVPETLGDSGILVTEKRYDVIGELLYCLVSDPGLREQVIRKQRERLAAFEQGVVEGQIKAWLESLHDME
jgi:glycosyltransferase involved in cell wall biosynthesis